MIKKITLYEIEFEGETWQTSRLDDFDNYMLLMGMSWECLEPSEDLKEYVKSVAFTD